MKRHWPWALTGAVLGLAAWVAAETEGWPRAGDVGDFVAGFSGALAFIWLIAGYLQQRDELALQREELKAQRESLDLQKAELHRMAVNAALGQIATMLMDFRTRLPQYGVPNLNSYEDIGHKLMEYLNELGRASRATEVETIINSYSAWRWRENIALRFFAALKMGAEIYARDGEVTLRHEEDPVRFVMLNDAALRSIPHISDCMHPALAIARALDSLRPWRDRARERYVAAMSQRSPEWVPDTELALAMESQVGRFQAENKL